MGDVLPASLPGRYILQMIRRSIRTMTAALLVALLGILNSGVPSHSHETDGPATRNGHATISAESHSHGVILVEASEQVASTNAQVAVLAVEFDTTAVDGPDRRLQTFDAAPIRPSERGPPPAAPRAPPQFI